MKFILILFLLISTLIFADNTVQIKAVKAGDNILVLGNNSNPFSVTVTYEADFKNLSTDVKMPMLFVLQPHSKIEVLKLHIDENNFSFKAHYDWTLGSKDAKHNDAYVYRLPYKAGTSQMVSQGYNGEFTHFGKSQYAVDFNLKEGTEVYAAREGVVIITKADSNKGGANKDFEKDANHVIIEHSDGTLASYDHLMQNGVVVNVGQKIQRGQLLGYSGKTGYARGPHLHFIVYKAIDGTHRESIPVKFMGADGIIDTPHEGMFYQATSDNRE
jgi:murein DD-endopeptidase MepM/ murein hydrolase activator NlpD